MAVEKTAVVNGGPRNDGTATRSSRPVRHYHHGRSPAAWTGVVIAGVGFIVATVAALAGPNWTLAIVGGALLVLALIVAGAMKAAGYGND